MNETEAKNFVAKVLAHQLEGLMLHTDFATMYAALGDKTQCKFHKCQAIDEMKAHLYTATEAATHFGEAIEPAKIQRIAVSVVPVTNDMTEEEIQEVEEKAREIWKNWEDESLEMYQNLAQKNPNSRLWPRLASNVETEIRNLKRMEKHSK